MNGSTATTLLIYTSSFWASWCLCSQTDNAGGGQIVRRLLFMTTNLEPRISVSSVGLRNSPTGVSTSNVWHRQVKGDKPTAHNSSWSTNMIKTQFTLRTGRLWHKWGQQQLLTCCLQSLHSKMLNWVWHTYWTLMVAGTPQRKMAAHVSSCNVNTHRWACYFSTLSK